MPIPLIKKLHEIFLETKTVNLPPELLPASTEYNLINWAKELYNYYSEEGIIVRAFDDLPPLKLSAEECISTRIQDVHAFIINDLNMIPLKTRRAVISTILTHTKAEQAWESVAPLLLDTFHNLEPEEAQQELSWSCSPVLEILWALSWFFMEMEAIRPPETIHMNSRRFPYYHWMEADGNVSLWQPELPLCRPQYLAMDLFRRKLESDD